MESGHKNVITFINIFSEIEIDLWSGGIFFRTKHTLLKKLQSIDSKAIKLASGVPVHTNTSKSYAEAGMISLSERKLAISKYVFRSLAVTNSVTEVIFIDSNKDYLKSDQNIPSIQPIRNYINDLINECNIDIKSIPGLPTSPQTPQWENINAISCMNATNSHHVSECVAAGVCVCVCVCVCGGGGGRVGGGGDKQTDRQRANRQTKKDKETDAK